MAVQWVTVSSHSEGVLDWIPIEGFRVWLGLCLWRCTPTTDQHMRIRFTDDSKLSLGANACLCLC